MNQPTPHPLLASCQWTYDGNLLTPRTDRALDALRLALVTAMNAELDARDVIQERSARTPAALDACALAHEKTLVIKYAFDQYVERFGDAQA